MDVIFILIIVVIGGMFLWAALQGAYEGIHYQVTGELTEREKREAEEKARLQAEMLIATVKSGGDVSKTVDKLSGYDKMKQKQETKEIVKGAVTGAIIGGDAGAVVGAVVAKNKIDNQKK